MSSTVPSVDPRDTITDCAEQLGHAMSARQQPDWTQVAILASRALHAALAQLPGSTNLSKAMSHPLRVGIIDRLQQPPVDGLPGWSPSQLSEALDAALGVTAYHVRALESAGVIELAGTRPVRGAVEHFYRLAQ